MRLRRSRRPRLERKIFFIHIMKTAGTSFRKMLIEAVRSPRHVYPNDRDLGRLRNGWYPAPQDLYRQRASLRDFDVLVGHYPSIMGEVLFDEPYRSVVLLREPVARSVSMIAHRIARRPELAGLSIREVLDDEDFARRQIENYQTKIFAYDSLEECAESVNTPLPITQERYERALSRLAKVDVVGLTERFAESLRLVEARTGLRFHDTIRTNRRGLGTEEIGREPELIERVRELIPYDLRLYQAAKQLFEQRLARAQGSPAATSAPAAAAAE